MTDTYTFQDQVKAIIIMREQYKNSRYGTSLAEEMRVWNNLLDECERRGIDSDILLINEDAFQLMLQNEQVIVDYLKK